MRKLENRRIPNGTYGGVRGRRATARLLLDCADTCCVISAGMAGRNKQSWLRKKDVNHCDWRSFILLEYLLPHLGWNGEQQVSLINRKNVNRFDWRFYFIYTIMFRYISADTVNNGPRWSKETIQQLWQNKLLLYSKHNKMSLNDCRVCQESCVTSNL